MSDHGTGPVHPIASRRMARRLLAGSGAAEVTAYRYPGADALAVVHALDRTGRVLVAACPPPTHPLNVVGAERPSEVRLDVRLESADASVRVTTATAHLLGVLTWLGADEAAEVLEGRAAGCHCPITGEDPLLSLGEIARAPGGRLGVVRTERVMVHDLHGVSGHDLSDLLTPDSAGFIWSDTDTLSAQEEVRDLGNTALTLLCEGVVEGALAGSLCSHRPVEGLCPSLHGRVLCADIAPEGVTLMHVSTTCVETIQVALPAGTRRACEVEPFLRDCVQDVLVAQLRRG